MSTRWVKNIESSNYCTNYLLMTMKSGKKIMRIFSSGFKGANFEQNASKMDKNGPKMMRFELQYIFNSTFSTKNSTYIRPKFDIDSV